MAAESGPANPVDKGEHGKGALVFIVEGILGAIGVPLEVLIMAFPVALLWAYPQLRGWAFASRPRIRTVVGVYVMLLIAVSLGGYWYRLVNHPQPPTAKEIAEEVAKRLPAPANISPVATMPDLTEQVEKALARDRAIERAKQQEKERLAEIEKDKKDGEALRQLISVPGFEPPLGTTQNSEYTIQILMSFSDQLKTHKDKCKEMKPGVYEGTARGLLARTLFWLRGSGYEADASRLEDGRPRSMPRVVMPNCEPVNRETALWIQVRLYVIDEIIADLRRKGDG
jgi:hypothetical protein